MKIWNFQKKVEVFLTRTCSIFNFKCCYVNQKNHIFKRTIRFKWREQERESERENCRFEKRKREREKGGKKENERQRELTKARKERSAKYLSLYTFITNINKKFILFFLKFLFSFKNIFEFLKKREWLFQDVVLFFKLLLTSLYFIFFTSIVLFMQ